MNSYGNSIEVNLKDIPSGFKVINEFRAKKFVKGKMYIQAYFPKPGKYELEIYGFSPDWTHIAKYVVYATKGTSQSKAQNKFLSPYNFLQSNSKYSKNSPLNKKIEITKLKSPDSLRPVTQAENANVLDVEFAYLNGLKWPSPVIKYSESDNVYALGWIDHNLNAHVDILNENLKIVKSNLIELPEQLIDDLVIQDGAVTAITRSINGVRTAFDLFITKYSLKGSEIFRKQLMQAPKDTKSWAVNDQGFDGQGNLVWTGKHFAIHGSTAKKWDDNVVHSADLLLFVDKKGNLVKDVGYLWGVSHSFRPRLAFNGVELLTGTTGDAYPRAQHIKIHRPEYIGKKNTEIYSGDLLKGSGDVGDNDAKMSTGNLLAVDDGFLFSFDSKEGRSSYDVGFHHISKDGKKKKTYWVTNTKNQQDRTPKIAKYGKNYLIVWGSYYDETQDLQKLPWGVPLRNVDILAAVFSPQGKIIQGPEKLNINIRENSQIFNFQNGDVGLISDVNFSDGVSIIRIKK